MTSLVTPLRPDQLPLVSILIINENDAPHISQSIRSVRAQDYPNIECLIVDNGSTDDSLEVIQAEITGHPQFRLIRLGTNLGQLGALFKVFEQCKGEFINILDAADMLSASFVSCHVQVHLALPRPVALTSSKVTQIDAQGCIRSERFKHFGSDSFWDVPGLVDRHLATRVPSVPDAEFDRLSARICTLRFERSGWFWSPTSAGMYRRTPLGLIQQARTPAKYPWPAHAYLNPFCHAVGGSALIDVSLSRYRVDDANSLATHQTISGINGGQGEFVAPPTELALESADFFLANSLRFQQLLGAERYWEVLDQLTGSMTASKVYSSGAFVDSVVRHMPILRKTFGDARLARQLINRLKPLQLSDLIGKCARSPANFGFVVKTGSRIIFEPITGKRRRTRRRSRKADRQTPENGYPAKPHDFGPVALISPDPPIFKTGIAFDQWLGIAGAFGCRFGDAPAGFLIYPAWSIEGHGRIARIGHAVREHRRRFPSHRLIFMANSSREAALLAVEGIPSVFLNKNFTVSDKIFRPLDDARPEFDAIYNARFVPEKRHELASAIERAAYVTFVDAAEDESQSQVDLMERVLRENPRHTVLNPIIGGRPERLSPMATNLQINRAPVGLCLSAIEGQNNASMEYMLAGLGVVSTPSKGGRDVYFDPEFCIICDPHPKAVRDAVAELRGRRIPREHIRQATLRRVEAERRRFLELVDDLRVKLGGRPGQKKDWAEFADTSGIVAWDTFDAHLERFGAANLSFQSNASEHAVSGVQTGRTSTAS